jgi:hypothetical protein
MYARLPAGVRGVGTPTVYRLEPTGPVIPAALVPLLQRPQTRQIPGTIPEVSGFRGVAYHQLT